jgi:tRNA (cmo5U34)-methyltransferase
MAKNTWIEDPSQRQAKEYVDEADQFIVERRTTREMLVRLFEYRFPESNGLQLLELGCGDGFITKAICERHPGNYYTLLDGSPEMLRQARQQLPGDRFRFVEGVLEGYSVAEAMKYDFIYSSNAIHHLSFDQKASLYRKIYDSLNTGGMFINIDVVLSPTDLCETWQLNLWRDWMLARQLEAGSEDPHRWDELPRHYKEKEENQPSELFEQLSLLSRIGFGNVDCYYKHGIFTLFGGTR